MNWVFGLLTRIPLSSKAFLHDSRYSVMSTSLSPHNTMSSANSIDSGAFFLTLSVSTSISMRKRYGLKADPWCRPTSTLNLLLSPATAHLRSASNVLTGLASIAVIRLGLLLLQLYDWACFYCSYTTGLASIAVIRLGLLLLQLYDWACFYCSYTTGLASIAVIRLGLLLLQLYDWACFYCSYTTGLASIAVI